MVLLISGRLSAIAAVIAIVAMLATAAAYGLAKGALRDSRAKTYRTFLQARAEMLDQWLEERLADARYISADPEVLKLTQRARRAGNRVCADANVTSAALAAILTLHFSENAPLAAHIAAPDGRILVSLSGHCGKRLSSFVLDQLPDAKQQGPATVNPLTESERLEGAAASEKQVRMIWFESEIHDSAGQRIAFIGYGLDAARYFDKGLQDTEAEFRGEFFAFDRRGVILNRGIHSADSPLVKEALAEAGRSDPQGDGTLMEPFDGRTARPAVGAWRWLKAGNIGLGLEVAARDIYQSIEFLRGLSALLGGAGVVLGALAFWLRRSKTGPGGELRRIGPYRIISQLGEGAVSNVYLAEHVLMRRRVALKILKPQFTTDEWIERFKREVRLAGQLQHPNFVRIYDFGLISGGHFYYAMEHIDGVNFAELVEQEGTQQPDQTARLLRSVCEGLEEAHALGILHRDIKPHNLMVRRGSGEEQQVKILDFGLVKVVNSDHSRDLTVGLRILGTPAYLAPERIMAPAGADPRSDLYSVGAVGFFLLTGRKIFESESDLLLTHRIVHEPAPRVSDFSPGNVTPELDDLISRCLAKDPAQRPASARLLADELAAITASVIIDGVLRR